jgi:hypothetical protein
VMRWPLARRTVVALTKIPGVPLMVQAPSWRIRWP